MSRSAKILNWVGAAIVVVVIVMVFLGSYAIRRIAGGGMGPTHTDNVKMSKVAGVFGNRYSFEVDSFVPLEGDSAETAVSAPPALKEAFLEKAFELTATVIPRAKLIEGRYNVVMTFETELPFGSNLVFATLSDTEGNKLDRYQAGHSLLGFRRLEIDPADTLLVSVWCDSFSLTPRFIVRYRFFPCESIDN